MPVQLSSHLRQVDFDSYADLQTRTKVYSLSGVITCPDGLSEVKEHLLLSSSVATASLATLQVFMTTLTLLINVL